MLTEQQQKAIKILNEIGTPCGLITILSKSKGAFGSKALLKETLKQLVAIGEVTFQSNSQYKIVTKKNQTSNQIGQTKGSVKANTKKTTRKAAMSEPIELKVVPKVFALPTPINESLAELELKLKKGELSIDELSLKIEVLQRLSLLLSDDISGVLSDIAKDLIEANAAA